MMLEGNRLSIAFGGVRAVTDVTLRIARGELVGLIGPNGAGKTTLLRLLTGVLAPDAGSVMFEARDVTGTPIHRRAQLGFVLTHQIVRPFRDMSLLENVMVAAAMNLTRRPWRALVAVDARPARERARAARAARHRRRGRQARAQRAARLPEAHAGRARTGARAQAADAG